MIFNLKNTRSKVFDNFYLTIVGSDLLIGKSGQQLYLGLDQITNFRIRKERSLIINTAIAVVVVVCAYALIDLYHITLLYQIILAAFILLALRLAFSLRFYSYKLLINMRGCEFNEIEIPEDYVFHANTILHFIVNKSVISESHEHDLYE